MIFSAIVMALILGVVNNVLNHNSNWNQGCGENIHLYNNDVQFVSSPNVGSDLYPNNVDCWWNISVSQGSRIIVASNFILLEPSHECLYDYVEILDKPECDSHVMSVGRFCWDNPVQYISTTEKIYIRFHSDDFVNGLGFTLSLSKVKPGAANVCNTTTTSGRNQLSINYPGNYPPNTVCFYHIQAPKKKQVKLSFLDFKLEKSPCTSDYLKVYDGASSASTHVGSYCGSTSPESISSSSRDMFLVFSSDDVIEHKGFNILIEFVAENQDKQHTLIDKHVQQKYDQECSHVISTLGHNLTSPTSDTKGYQKGKYCSTTLLAPVNHIVVLHLVSIAIEQSSECQFDYLRISQGDTDNKTFFKLCGYHSQGVSIISKGRQLQLEFITDTSVEANGYFATYTFENKRTIADLKYDRIQSCPDHPCGFSGTCYNDGTGYKCACPSGLVPPDCLKVLEFTDRSKNSTVTTSSSVTLKCRVNHPHAVTVWYSEAKLITPSQYFVFGDNGDLIISSVKSVHQGKYTCDVLASGTVLSHSLWLTVHQLPLDHLCGISDLFIRGNSGDPTNITIPWQAFLWSKQNNTFCGGAIISERWILTAAHCITQYGGGNTNNIFNNKNIKVYAGTNDCTAKQPGIKMMMIKSFTIHPRYTPDSLDNDIALIQLQDKFKFTDYLRPVCLPDLGNAKSLAKPGVIGVASGCGYLETQRKLLRFLRVPIIDAATCLKSVSRVKLSPGSFLCAGYAKKGLGDTCKGDSGGALVVRHHWKWYLVGLVSFGEGYDKNDKYGFYTNVSNYYHWIKTFTDGCGRNSDLDKLHMANSQRILGGKQADLGLLPWVVGIREYGKTDYFCVGVILGEYWVLTAAHCVAQNRHIVVVVGGIEQFSGRPGEANFPLQVLAVIRTHSHSHYNYNRKQRTVHDLALLHLNSRKIYSKWKFMKGIEFSTFSRPVCLPPDTDQQPGSQCIISGWGQKNSKTLKWATVTVTDQETCERLYGVEIKQGSKLMCAGKNNTDISSGDSGGGLICKSKSKDRYHVTGIATLSQVKPGEFPAGFTRIEPYISWIQQTIKNNSYYFEDWDIFGENACFSRQ